MQFLYPSFLYALFAVIIPIIIHYFNFRKYKTVYFSDIHLLQSIKQEAQSRNKIRHILVLLIRILFIAALVFAFTKPYIPVDRSVVSNKQNLVNVYIDNSFSMEGESVAGNLLGIAKNKAIEIADAYPNNTKFMLSCNEYFPFLNHAMSKEQFVNQVSKLAISSRSRQISEIYERQIDLMNEAEINLNTSFNNEIYWISDVQKSTTDLVNIDTSNIRISLLMLQSQNLGNIYIDSCWFVTPARIYKQPEKLMVKLVNNSGNSYSNFPVKLFINDSVKSLSSTTLKPNSSVNVEMVYTNNIDGIINGRIEINDYPITFDNILYFNYIVRQKSKLLIVQAEKGNNYINALFENDDYFGVDFADINKLDYSDFSNYQVIVLNSLTEISTGFIQQIKKYLENGGTCIIFPGQKLDYSSYNLFLKTINLGRIEGEDSIQKRANRFLYEDMIYTDVFTSVSEDISYPVIYRHFILKESNQAKAVKIIANDTDDPVLLTTSFGDGNAYLFSFPLDLKFTDFPENPLFVPTVYNIALFNQHHFELYYQIGKDKLAAINTLSDLKNINMLKLVNNLQQFESKADIINADFNKLIEIPGSVNNAGNYDILINDNRENSLSFNYSRNESQLEFYSDSELNDIIETNKLNNINLLQNSDRNITSSIKETNQGRQLWKLFMLISLLLLAIEVFILRVVYRN